MGNLSTAIWRNLRLLFQLAPGPAHRGGVLLRGHSPSSHACPFMLLLLGIQQAGEKGSALHPASRDDEVPRRPPQRSKLCSLALLILVVLPLNV
eukprot:6498968-Pyramimonas_sp.AAC.1